MNNFETIENIPAADEDWQKEKDSWEKEVKEEVWPVYKDGIDRVQAAYGDLEKVFKSSADDFKRIAELAHVVNIVARGALDEFDSISENTLNVARKTSAMFLAASMVNHRARKFFARIISMTALLEMLIHDNETDKLELLPLDKQNLINEDYFLNILEVGSPKLINASLCLESFKYSSNSDDSFVIETNNDLPNRQIKLSYELLIDEAIREFINNAKEAMGGKGRVVVGAYLEGNNLCFYVQDNGPGIPKEKQKEIWKAKVSAKEHGMGMGLHYLKTVVEDLMHGSVTVESEEGEGAKFTISFPESK